MLAVMNRHGDIFNDRFHEYNICDCATYNCGGYALGLEGWYMPYITPYRAQYEADNAYDEANYYATNAGNLEEEDAKRVKWVKFVNKYWEDIFDDVIEGFRDWFAACFGMAPTEADEDRLGDWDSEDSFDLSVYVMLHSFPWLRLVNSFDELDKDEYGVAFAIGNGDFHFCRYDDGIYTHKMGGGIIEEVESYEKAFEGNWSWNYSRYNIGPALFAAKKEHLRKESI